MCNCSTTTLANCSWGNFTFTSNETKTFHVTQRECEPATVKATEFIAKGKNVWFYDSDGRTVAYFTNVDWVAE